MHPSRAFELGATGEAEARLTARFSRGDKAIEILRQPEIHDVVVVGSGASGGTAVYNLARKGIKVLLLDAGGEFNRRRFWTHELPFEADERRRSGETPPPFYLDKEEQPYLTPDDQPFDLVRVWGRGGKTNTWGRVSLRMSELDFSSAERDGWGIPWPISYEDVAPYYDRVEQLIGVCGGNDDSEVLPGSKYHLPAPAPRCGEVLVEKAAESLGIPVVSTRRANLTRPHQGFPACHYCGECGSGCRAASFYNSTDYMISPALETGNLQVVSNAVVARIFVDERGRAAEVQYFDRDSGQEARVRARVVVLGASCMDTTRILLNSKSGAHPNGLGNASDMLGKNYCEQIMVHVRGFLPQLFGRGYTNDDGIGGGHLYIPRFNHRMENLDYLRGFGIQFWATGCQMTGVPAASRIPGFGASFKAEVKKRYPSFVSLHPFGEILSRPDNRVSVDENETDRYGVPLMKIAVSFGENEEKMKRHMYETCEEILHTAGAEIVPIDRETYDPPGSAIHEHGTCRMGSDPKLSVLNKFNQMHEVDNLFVVDGAAFTNASEKNPTLTILALAWRATDYLAEEMRRGDL
jgi:choline dehydrogenase-like flavoprotein